MSGDLKAPGDIRHPAAQANRGPQLCSALINDFVRTLTGFGRHMLPGEELRGNRPWDQDNPEGGRSAVCRRSAAHADAR